MSSLYLSSPYSPRLDPDHACRYDQFQSLGTRSVMVAPDPYCYDQMQQVTTGSHTHTQTKNLLVVAIIFKHHFQISSNMV